MKTFIGAVVMVLLGSLMLFGCDNDFERTRTASGVLVPEGRYWSLADDHGYVWPLSNIEAYPELKTSKSIKVRLLLKRQDSKFYTILNIISDGKEKCSRCVYCEEHK